MNSGDSLFGPSTAERTVSCSAGEQLYTIAIPAGAEQPAGDGSGAGLHVDVEWFADCFAAQLSQQKAMTP